MELLKAIKISAAGMRAQGADVIEVGLVDTLAMCCCLGLPIADVDGIGS